MQGDEVYDEHHGLGGSYIRGRDGKRRLQERTKQLDDPEHETNKAAREDAAKAAVKPAATGKKE